MTGSLFHKCASAFYGSFFLVADEPDSFFFVLRGEQLMKTGAWSGRQEASKHKEESIHREERARSREKRKEMFRGRGRVRLRKRRVNITVIRYIF